MWTGGPSEDIPKARQVIKVEAGKAPGDLGPIGAFHTGPNLAYQIRQVYIAAVTGSDRFIEST